VVTVESNTDYLTWGNEPGRRDGTSSYRRSRRLAVFAAAAAIGLAACGHGAPHVATLGTSIPAASSGSESASTTAATAATAAGNPTALLNEWAACMRAHGDPNQADPTIDANKVIHITWDSAIPGGYFGTNKGGQGNSGPGQYCRSYLTEAQRALQGGTTPKRPDPAQLLKFSECMRANGIPDFPDPAGDNLSINIGAGGDLNPHNPAFKNASKVCAQKTGVQGFGPGTPPAGTITLNGAGGVLPNG
jgi:hypothetical protein